MLTKMTEEDWVLVLEVFHACRSRRGDKGRDDRKFFEALHYFTVHNITWRALPAKVRLLEQHQEALLALEPQRRVRNFLRSARLLERAGASRADVRLDRHPRACAGGRRKRGQDGEALGRSRGGFSTKIHLKTDLDGYPIGFHLTGGEASDSTTSKCKSPLQSAGANRTNDGQDQASNVSRYAARRRQQTMPHSSHSSADSS